VVAWFHGEVASRLGGVGGENEVIGGQGAPKVHDGEVP